MSFPLQVATSDRVLAAQVRGALMNGAAWSDVTTLTDNSGGTASDTLAVIYDTATKNAVASLAAKVNTILTRLNNLNA